MLQHNPTLTAGPILAALQGGAHPLRGPAQFDDQAGAGEVDVLGAVAAVDRLRDPAGPARARSESWLTLGGRRCTSPTVRRRSRRCSSCALARTRTPGTPPADGFAQSRLAAYALVDGRPFAGAAQLAAARPGGVARHRAAPAGLGVSQLTVGATFDGAPIVEAKTVPIATDVWTAEYPARIGGGCAVAFSTIGRRATRAGQGGPADRREGAGGILALAALALVRRRA